MEKKPSFKILACLSLALAFALSGCVVDDTSSIESTGEGTSSTIAEESSSAIESTESSAIDSDESSEETPADSTPEPPDISYYSSIDWTATGATLKTALYNLISKNFSSVGYDNLWSAYATTDVDEDGYIVDMYSSYQHEPPSKGQNSYSYEGAGINREHVTPQSIFKSTGANSNLKSDLFNVYPTDGYVNNRRDNYPHAEVKSATYTSSNGCMLGTSDVDGLSGSVFEVPDQWKGDIARSYFYTVTCYQNYVSSFASFSTFSKNTYPSLSSWAVDLYLEWNDLDPVDDWERERNEKVYAKQGNRNPFIDYEYAAHLIWDGAY